jgi:hypothetical protein
MFVQKGNFGGICPSRLALPEHLCYKHTVRALSVRCLAHEAVCPNSPPRSSPESRAYGARNVKSWTRGEDAAPNGANSQKPTANANSPFVSLRFPIYFYSKITLRSWPQPGIMELY